MSGLTALLRQSLRFGLVGILNTVVGLTAIYSLMFFFDARTGFANAAGYAAGLTVSFAMNRVWTFGNRQRIVHLLPKYLLVACLCYFLNLTVVLLIVASKSISPYWAQLFGVGTYTVTMFLGCRWFVFTSSGALASTTALSQARQP